MYCVVSCAVAVLDGSAEEEVGWISRSRERAEEAARDGDEDEGPPNLG